MAYDYSFDRLSCLQFYLKERRVKLIQITQMEADYIIKNVPDRKLKKSSERKRHGGKTYYVLGDDASSLNVLAMLRGYTPIRKSYIDKEGRKRFRIISPAQQLCADY